MDPTVTQTAQQVAGSVAATERALMVDASVLMLIVVVPVIVLTLAFAWRYRASSTRAVRRPDWDRSPIIEWVVWGLPAVLVAVLAVMVWQSTHRLDPYKPLPGGPATEVQAVALNWKWLFIYPDQRVATVNDLVFPVDRPLSLRLTSDVAMNSFMIPALGGQIYAMSGMETRLNLRADAPGRFEGRNMQFTGADFPEQTFEARAVTRDDFDAWIADVRKHGTVLDTESYTTLLQAQATSPIVHFSSTTPGFFSDFLAGNGGMTHMKSAEIGND